MSSIRDVAAAAGVSRMTVSNVINGRHHKASAETVARVLRAIEELDYVPDAPARSLAANRSRMIGLVLHHPGQSRALLENPHDALLLGAVGQAVTRAGFSFIPAASRDVVRAARRLGSWRVDGLIVYGSVADEINDLTRTHPRPLVFLDNYSRRSEVPVVGVDDAGGGLAVGRHLIEHGHRAIAFAGPLTDAPGVVARRYEGVQRAILEHAATGDGLQGATHLIAVHADHHPGSAVRAVDEILAHPERPTAVVASSDVLAAEILGELLDRGIAVPGQMSVGGFDDSPVARWVRPQLTSVAQDIEAKARAAVAMLTRLIDDEQGERPGGEPPMAERLPMRLMVRESTGPAPRR